MKKLLVIVTATLVCLGAFAQGKIGFTQDSSHLAYYDPSVGGTLGGHTIYDSNMPPGITLVADLYMGTSSSSLSLYSTTTFGPIPGHWNTAQVTASNPFIAGGTSVFVEAQIRDQAFAPPGTFAGTPFGSYYGKSVMFNFTLGSGITFPPMYGPNGNWPAGNFDLGGVDGNPAGAKGAVSTSAVPEPASLALCGLGAAALLIFRRRK